MANEIKADYALLLDNLRHALYMSENNPYTEAGSILFLDSAYSDMRADLQERFLKKRDFGAPAFFSFEEYKDILDLYKATPEAGGNKEQINQMLFWMAHLAGWKRQDYTPADTMLSNLFRDTKYSPKIYGQELKKDLENIKYKVIGGKSILYTTGAAATDGVSEDTAEKSQVASEYIVMCNYHLVSEYCGDSKKQLLVTIIRNFANNIVDAERKRQQKGQHSLIPNKEEAAATLCNYLDRMMRAYDYLPKFETVRKDWLLARSLSWLVIGAMLRQSISKDLLENCLKPYLPELSQVIAGEKGKNNSAENEIIKVFHNTKLMHPSFWFLENMPSSQNTDIIPCSFRMIADNETEFDIQTMFKNSWSKNNSNHLIIEGEGGVGKTVFLLSVSDEEGLLPHKVTSVYIPLRRISEDVHGVDLIDEYLKDTFSSNAYEFISIKANMKWNNGPNILFLLDEYNEVTVEKRALIDRSLLLWSKCTGIQMVIASRFFPSFPMCAKRYILQPLDEITVHKYSLSRNVLLSTDSLAFSELLRIPLVLQLYLKYCSLDNNYIYDDNLNIRTIKKPTDLVWNMIQHEIGTIIHYDRLIQSNISIIDKITALLITIPYIAWKMAILKKYSIKDSELTSWLNECKDFSCRYHLLRLPQIQKIKWDYCITNNQETDNLFNIGFQYDIITKRISLFRKNGNDCNTIKYTFGHQKMRDILGAIFLINISELITQGVVKNFPRVFFNNVPYELNNYYTEYCDTELLFSLWEQYRLSNLNDNHVADFLLQKICEINNYDISECDFSGMDISNLNVSKYYSIDTDILKLPNYASHFNQSILSRNTFTYKHKGPIYIIKVLDDSQTAILVTNTDIRIWDIDNSLCKNTIEKKDEGKITALTIDKKNKHILAGYENGTINMWAVESGELLLTCMATLGTSISNLLFFEKYNRFVSIDAAGSVLIWYYEKKISTNGTCLKYKKRFLSNNNIYKNIIPYPDSPCILCLSVDNKISSWNIVKGDCDFILEGHKDYVCDVTISRDEKFCISVSADNTARIWDLNSHYCKQVLSGHSYIVNQAMLFNNDTMCLTTSYDNTSRIWRMSDGKCILILNKEGRHKIRLGDNRENVPFAMVINNDQWIISATDNTDIEIWDAETGIHLFSLINGKKRIISFGITPNGERCICCYSDESLCTWDIKSQRIIRQISSSPFMVRRLAYSKDEEAIYSTSNDGVIRAWDINTKQCTALLEGHVSNITCMKELTKSRLFSSTWTGYLRYWDLETDSTFFSTHANFTIMDLCEYVGNKKHFLYLGLDNGDICIKDYRHLDKIQTIIHAHYKEVYSLSISSDGKRLASGSFDGTVKIWDTNELTCLNAFPGHDGVVLSVIINEKNNTILSCASDGTIKVWDINNGQLIKTLCIDKYSIEKIQITNDNRCIAASANGCIYVWDLFSYELLATLIGHYDKVRDILYIEKKNLCVSASNEGSIRFWDMVTYSEVYRIDVLSEIMLIGTDLSLSIIKDSTLKKALIDNGATV